MPKPATRPVGLDLAQTAKAVSRAFDDALGEAGGSLPQWLVLLALRTGTPRTQRELAAAVGIEGATLSHHLAAMEAAGLVSRSREPGNRRVQTVSATEQGDALFFSMAKAARAHDRRLRRGLDADEVETLQRCLATMRANVTER